MRGQGIRVEDLGLMDERLGTWYDTVHLKGLGFGEILIIRSGVEVYELGFSSEEFKMALDNL